MKISLIIPVAHNASYNDLSNLLRSTLTQTLRDFEVLIVNDGGFALSVEEVASVKVLTPPEKIGASAARNYAARHATGQILGFLDSDVILDPRWCEEAVATFSQKAVGGASGDARVDLGKFGFAYVPKCLRWVVGGSYWRGGRIRVVTGAAGMNFCVRKDSFERAKGYDESLGPRADRPETQSWFRLGAEESDLAFRIRKVCQEAVVFNPRMIVTHKLRRETITLRGVTRRAMHVGRNRAYLHSRYAGSYGGGESEVLRETVVDLLSSLLQLFSHPVRSWKRISFTCLVVLGLAAGYLSGIVQFRHRDDFESKPPFLPYYLNRR